MNSALNPLITAHLRVSLAEISQNAELQNLKMASGTIQISTGKFH